jgi:SAM-dependent methyltransferase
MEARRQPPAPSRVDAAAFLDEDVVAAYEHRPPYPEDVIARLLGFGAPAPNAVLELGCGTGELSRRLAPHVARVDAVDPSEAMLRVARAAPGGDAPNITWVCSTGEDFAFTSTYSLAIAAESFHWMDASVVMPALQRVLVPDGRLAIVGRGEETPWSAAFHEIIVEYSAYAGPGVFRPRDVPAELSGARMWEVDERVVTPGVPFRQRTEDYIELQHSRASFARYRMGAARAAEFDEALRRLLTGYAEEGYVTYETTVLLAVGRPI